ncbi:MAG: hypothetical protein KAI86_03015 [Desulfobacterales bacterium]|nr:hypothetical protein [Desulfobacterales bacterium]
MSTIKIQGNVYNALRTVAATDDEVRYYLRGMLVDSSNSLFVATDGLRLLTYPIDTDASVYSVDLPDRIVSMSTRKADREGLIVVELNDDPASVDYMHATITSFSKTGKQKWRELVDVIDGKFPDYAKVIPALPATPHKVAPLTYNPTLIGSVVDALTSKPVPCRVLPTDAKGERALRVEVCGYPDAVLILMPMRWG